MSTPKAAPAAFTVPAALTRYGNLVFQDRPVHDGDVFSRKHPKMSQLNRAKIFAPFAALVGFYERVHRKEINYITKPELDADEEWELNHRLYGLHCLTANSRLARTNRIRVSVEYFVVCEDEENEAYRVKGQYKTISGIVMRVDPHGQRIMIYAEGETCLISFSDIYHIFVLPG